jgi:protocatechuate 4,5-dioxygenase beta chain
MPLELGLASSHAPSMFAPAEKWPQLHAALTRGVPQPPQAHEETPDVIQDYVCRIQRGFRTLRERLEGYQPDAVIIVGDDQTEVFSKALTPALAILVADEVAGTTNMRLLDQPLDQNHIRLNCHRALAAFLLERLVAKGFDLGAVEELTPLARPAAGLGHAFMRVANAIGLHESGIPTIIFFLNAYHPPMPTAERCYEVGRALREILAPRPERVALYASGGLSHNPFGPRAGWVDEPLDHWVLDSIASGEGERLKHLFTFDSDTLRSGTGEIRSWIVAAGAFPGVPASIVDYIPARHAVTGLGFAYWQANCVAY